MIGAVWSAGLPGIIGFDELDRFGSPTGWTTEYTSGPGQQFFYPKLAVAENGTGVVAFTVGGPLGDRLCVDPLVGGLPTVGSGCPNPVAWGDGGGPIGAAARDTGVALAWVDDRGAGRQMWTEWWQAGVGQGAVSATGTPGCAPTGVPSRPELAVRDDAGAHALVWRIDDDAGAWLAWIDAQQSVESCSALGSDTAARPSLDHVDDTDLAAVGCPLEELAVVAWEDRQPGQRDIAVDLRDPAGSLLSLPVNASADPLHSNERPDVAWAVHDGELRGVVTWETHTPPGSNQWQVQGRPFRVRCP